jgi:hypothetical protein
MFSIYAKVTTPESSPILGPAQSPTLQTFDPLDSTSKQQPQEQEQHQQEQQQLLDKMGGIGLLCACCSRARGSTTITGYDIAPLSDNITNINSIKTNAPITEVLEKCKHETHFTHYNYRVITPRQMPPF